MDSIGRPVEGVHTDHQEVQRRFDLEQPDELNYLLAAKQEQNQQGVNDLDPNEKVAYIKGEVGMLFID